jgi:hypothetical protein
MKTTKIFLITALMLFATMSFSTNHPANSSSTGTAAPQLNVKISLQEALLNPQLTMFMQQQVFPDLLKRGPDNLYFAELIFNNTLYHIYGTREQWMNFFSVAHGALHANF